MLCIVKYTSALHGMSIKQRMVMFNQIPFMVGWLGELSNVAEGVCQFLEAVKEKNRIPSNPQSEEKWLQKPKPYLTVSMTFVILPANQSTRSIRKKISGIGQSVVPGTGRYWDMELHAVDPFPASADKEFHNHNRVESIAWAYQFLWHWGLAKALARTSRLQICIHP